MAEFRTNRPETKVNRPEHWRQEPTEAKKPEDTKPDGTDSTSGADKPSTPDVPKPPNISDSARAKVEGATDQAKQKPAEPLVIGPRELKQQLPPPPEKPPPPPPPPAPSTMGR